MSTIEMVWEDPQPRRRPGRGGGVHAQVLAQLKKNPGRWCMVQQAKSSPSTTWWKERGCEATTRTQDDKTVKLYVRWPEPAAEAAVAAPAAEPQAETPQAPAEPEPSTPRATPEPSQEEARRPEAAPRRPGCPRGAEAAQPTSSSCPPRAPPRSSASTWATASAAAAACSSTASWTSASSAATASTPRPPRRHDRELPPHQRGRHCRRLHRPGVRLCRSRPNCDTEEWNEHGCAEHDREHALTPGHECWQARNVNAWGGPYPDDQPDLRPGAPVTLTYEGEGIVTWDYVNGARP